jgi:hypothetical protein
VSCPLRPSQHAWARQAPADAEGRTSDEGRRVEAHIHAVSVGAQLAGCVECVGFRQATACACKNTQDVTNLDTRATCVKDVHAIRERTELTQRLLMMPCSSLPTAELRWGMQPSMRGMCAMHADTTRQSVCMRRECVQYSRAAWACSLQSQSWLLALQPMQQHRFPARGAEWV